MFRKTAPHILIIFSVVIVVLAILDGFNPMMAFWASNITKTLCIIFGLFCLIYGIDTVIHRYKTALIRKLRRKK